MFDGMLLDFWECENENIYSHVNWKVSKRLSGIFYFWEKWEFHVYIHFIPIKGGSKFDL